ncbi:MAG TPA: DUF58 domain-containing protein [Pirellulales bacterium]|nr:DUF58 domain-containing protein [Pirellulales bacterium]
MRTPQLPKITIEGLCYITMLAFLLAGALIRQINLLLALFALLVSLPLVNRWLVWATLRRLKVERRIPRSTAAGDLLLVELSVVNPQKRLASWAITIDDQIRRIGAPSGEAAISARTLVPYVAARGDAVQSYRGRIMRRGRYEFGPIHLSTRFPFGMIHGETTIEEPQSLLVLPRLGRLTRRWQRLQQSSDVGSSHVQRRQGLLEGDFYGLRHWRPGDSRRWIHWRTSARRQTPVVRQFEQQRNQDLALVLELWQPDEPSETDLANVELAVSFAASIVSDLCRRGGQMLWIAVAARETHWNCGPTSLALTREVMESLATAEGANSDRLPEALSRTLEAARPGTNAILISTRPVDLSDTERFQRLWRNPRQRAWLGRLQSINVAHTNLSDYFIPV